MNPDPLLRISQIIGSKATPSRSAVPALIPVSRTTWWAGVKAGRYPQPVKLGARCVAWKTSDILALTKGGTP